MGCGSSKAAKVMPVDAVEEEGEEDMGVVPGKVRWGEEDEDSGGSGRKEAEEGSRDSRDSGDSGDHDNHNSEEMGGNGIRHGSVVSRGKKRYMEDAVVEMEVGMSMGMTPLGVDSGEEGTSSVAHGVGGRFGLFAVLDGHSADKREGADAARLVGQTLPLAVMEEMRRETQAHPRDLTLNAGAVMAGAFARAELEMRMVAEDGGLSPRKKSRVGAHSGSRGGAPFQYAGTGVTLALVSLDRHDTASALHVAHVGDASAVLIDLRTETAIALTGDHTVANEEETARVEASGGFLTDDARFGKRANGLKVTRSLGDFGCYGTISDPGVTSLSLDPQAHRWLVLASDGLWDVVTPEDVVSFCLARTHPSANTDPNHMAAGLRSIAAKRGGVDNISVLVVDLFPSASSSASGRASSSSRASGGHGRAGEDDDDHRLTKSSMY